ncbi:MAG: minor capsid protein [Archaeoglobaceae archaeon]
MLVAFALGIDHLAKDIEITFTDPLKAEIIPEPVPFEEAERYLLSQIPVTKEEWEKLDKNFRLHAFTVARLTELDAIERVKQHLAKVKQEGKTFKHFWETAGKDELLRQAGFHRTNPWYWEIVFRNNIQRAYNAGRAYQIQKSEAVEYLEFVGIRDARQSPICRARSGIIRPKGDPFWSSNWPPLHHGCRSTVRPVTRYEMKWYNLAPTKELPPMPTPQKGFGDYPDLRAGAVFKMSEQMWERAKQYGIDEEIKKSYQKLYPAMDLPKSKEVKNLLWHERVRHLDFSKDEHVAEFLDFLAETKPEWFPGGLRVSIYDQSPVRKKIFMSVLIPTKTLYLYKQKGQLDFDALQELKFALHKMKYKQPLSLKEKTALYAIWHEIWHLQAKNGFTYRAGKGEVYFMEAINDYLSRKTLGEFLKTLGHEFSPKDWATAFAQSGYHKHVEVVEKLIEFGKITDEELKKILLTEYDGIAFRVSDLIGTKLNWGLGKVNLLTVLITDYFHDIDNFIKLFRKNFRGNK